MYNINYIHLTKPLWCNWLSDHVWFCGSAPEVKCSIHGHCTSFLYYIIIIITITVIESVGHPSDFGWLCLLEFRWCLMVISSRLDADLLLVHWKSVGLTSLTRNAQTSSRNSPENYSTCMTEEFPFWLPKVWLESAQKSSGSVKTLPEACI